MKKSASFCLCLLAISPSVFARAGDLDPTFGNGGVATTAFMRHAYGYAVAIQGDQKIVVAGLSDGVGGNDYALARYNADGSLDSTFNNTGKIKTDFNSFIDEATCMAIQPDGKIIAAGVSDNGNDFDFSLARYQSNGKLDRSFSQDGKVTTNFGNGAEDDLYAILFSPTGK